MTAPETDEGRVPSESRRETTGPESPSTGGLPALRGYQREAVDAIVQGQADGGRGQVRAACGTGKTIVSLHAARRLCPDGLVVVACPSLPLLAQTLTVWAATGTVNRILAVCGDDSIVPTSGDGALACPVTTRPAEISAWLRDTPTGQPRLILVTHASAGLLGDGLTQAGVVADLLIVDEAHHTAGWGGKHNSLLHDDDRLPARRRLYLSATPRVLTRRRPGDDDLLSMDDPQVFGPVRYQYPFARAIADGWLDDYRILVIGVTSHEALALLRDTDTHAVTDLHGAPLRTTAIQTALIRAATEFGLRRILVFTSRIAQSRAFATTLPRTFAATPEHLRPKGLLTTGHVDGTQNAAQRDIHLARLAHPPQDGWTVISNARCLSEGVDVPAVDAVVFTSPKESEVDVAQAVGRALRRNPDGSGIATVLVPVLLPDDPDDAPTDLAEWDTLLKVLRALRAHDGDLATDLDTRRTTLTTSSGGESGGGLPQRVIIRLPDGYATDDLLRHITIRVLEETTSDWWAGYGALKTYAREHGHLRITPRHTTNGIRLDNWVRQQRFTYKTGRLSQDRVDALNRLGFDWAPVASAWERGLAAATAFHAEHGHLNPPHRHTVDGVNLTTWLSTQRHLHQKGRLPTDRTAVLTQLGISWKRKTRTPDECWQAVLKFHHTHGHLRVPSGTTIDGVDVYLWVVSRRVDHQKGRLTPERFQTLTAMGMQWDAPEKPWPRKYAAATAFYQREGHLRPPPRHIEDGVKLTQWLIEQRRVHRSGRMPPDRIHALNTIGMQWDWTNHPKEKS
ncbi:Helicase associated domain protein [Micromonospora sp. WMMD730]|uniref:DEAD/DEAH box helicase n=1 Tax=Micromonospora sp. WMMD730 TaxID=3404128 RepID=UPI003B939B46